MLPILDAHQYQRKLSQDIMKNSMQKSYIQVKLCVMKYILNSILQFDVTGKANKDPFRIFLYKNAISSVKKILSIKLCIGFFLITSPILCHGPGPGPVIYLVPALFPVLIKIWSCHSVHIMQLHINL